MRSAGAWLRSLVTTAIAVVALSLLVFAGQTTALAVPTNDNFPGYVIDSVPSSSVLDNIGATLQDSEPQPYCFLPIVSTVWWTFRPPKTAVYLLDFRGGEGFYPGGSISGTNPFPYGTSDMACLGFATDEGDGLHTQLSFSAVQGHEYFIQLGGRGNEQGEPTANSVGTLTISITLATAPTNDNFSKAKLVPSLPYEDAVALDGATVESDEPYTPCFNYYEPGDVRIGSSAWYTYTAAGSGVVSIEPETVDQYYLAGVSAVWSGPRGNLSLEACGDISGFLATAGKTYYIQVGLRKYGDPEFGHPGPAGLRFKMELQELPNCSGATRTFVDPLHDLINPYDFERSPTKYTPDAIEITASANAKWACLTVKYAEPIVPNADDGVDVLSLRLFIDTDEAPYSGVDEVGPCAATDFRYEVVATPNNSRSLAATALTTPYYQAEHLRAFQFSTADSITLVLQISDIGDAGFRFAGETFYHHSDVDCLYDEVHDAFKVLPPLKSKFGDVNCDGLVTPKDDVEVLQGAASVDVPDHAGCPPVGTSLAATYAIPAASSSMFISGDIDCDGLVTPRDALSLLREVAHTPRQRPAGCPAVGDPPLS